MRAQESERRAGQTDFGSRTLSEKSGSGRASDAYASGRHNEVGFAGKHIAIICDQKTGRRSVKDRTCPD